MSSARPPPFHLLSFPLIIAAAFAAAIPPSGLSLALSLVGGKVLLLPELNFEQTFSTSLHKEPLPSHMNAKSKKGARG